MNIGIVTTWFERGAAYVSKQFEEALEKEHSVFIFARGEEYAIGDHNWDRENVYWSQKIESPLSGYIDKNEFVAWIERNSIDIILFNEQRFWDPIYWCAEIGVKSVAYVDYYTEQTLPLFDMYDLVICNTHKHYQAMNKVVASNKLRYIPWGTDVELYSNVIANLVDYKCLTFFHSAGYNPFRKGTDILIEAFYKMHTKAPSKLIVHTQIDIASTFPHLSKVISELESIDKLQIISKTVSAPGLYHLGDVYVYPSRLDGLGLTVAEACSSGLALIVTNDGPMNEFVSEKYGRVIDVENYEERADGYYWPQAIVSRESLSNIMLELSLDLKSVKKMKLKAREAAVNNYNWKTNVSDLSQLFKSMREIKVSIREKEELIKKARIINDKKYPFIHSAHCFYSLLKRIKNVLK